MRSAGAEATNRRPGGTARRVARLVLNVVEMLGLLFVALALASSWFGWSSPILFALMAGVLPFWMIVAFAVGVLAGFRRHWVQLGVAVAALATIGSLTLPALRSVGAAGVVAKTPRLRVFTSNLFVSNSRYDEMADAIMAADADVIVLVELTPWFVDRLRIRGVLDRYPNQILDPRSDSTGTGIIARVAVMDSSTRTIGQYSAPSITVQLDGRTLTIVAAHPLPPSSQTGPKPWVGYFHALHEVAAAATDEFVVTGDFNATRWHRPFARLLDGTLRDAHETVGKGLTMSWPARWLPVRIMRLDHLLATRGVAIVKVDNIAMPGSDHTAFVVDLAMADTPVP